MPILEKQAQGNNKTKEEMAAHYLEKILAREYKEEVKRKIEVEPIENVKIYDTAIEAERVKIYPKIELTPEQIAFNQAAAEEISNQ